MNALNELQEHFQSLHDIGHAAQYLSWDEAVMMSDEGGDARAKESCNSTSDFSRNGNGTENC